MKRVFGLALILLLLLLTACSNSGMSEKEYLKYVDNTRTSMVADTGTLSMLLSSIDSDIDSEQWATNFLNTEKDIERIYKESKTIVPPKKYEEADRNLKTAIKEFNFSIDSLKDYMKSDDEFDSDALNGHLSKSDNAMKEFNVLMDANDE